MNESNIRIDKEKKEEMVSLVKDFFANEREEDIGDLAALVILDFFIEELAPEFYNQGVLDSHQFMNEKLEDLFGIQVYKR